MVEEVALAESQQVSGAEGGAGVKQAVCDVNSPRREGEQHRNPERKTNAG
jgi:hypothetical protein